MKITDIQEDTRGGYTGGSNIASAPGRMDSTPIRRQLNHRSGDNNWREDAIAQRDAQRDPSNVARSEVAGRQQQNLKAAKERLAKQRTFLGRLKQFLEKRQRPQFQISESFDMNDVLSRLSSLETGGEAGESTVSYGIEDDDGNLMKVTVRADQAEEFEERLANELADAAQRREVTGEKTSISMAELLLKLNDEFEIVDASFPTIPSDGVYNADKVQYGVADTAQEDIGGDLDAFPDDAAMGGDPMATTGPEGAVDPNGIPAGLEGEDPMAGGMEGDPMGGDMEGGEGDEFFDDGSVEDFPAEPDAVANPEENLLTAVLKMLTADAEAKKAQADAEAEKARAQQAEYTAMAAKNSVAQQEEVMRMEAEMEQQKAKEKDAKRIADLARYRVSKAGSFSEGTKPSFGQYLDLVLEFEEFDTVQSLNRQRSSLRMKYAVASTDDPETARYKREAFQQAMIELNAKIKHAASAQRYRDAKEKRDGAKQPQQPQTPQQQALAKQQAAQQGMPGQQQGQPNAL